MEIEKAEIKINKLKPEANIIRGSMNVSFEVPESDDPEETFISCDVAIPGSQRGAKTRSRSAGWELIQKSANLLTETVAAYPKEKDSSTPTAAEFVAAGVDYTTMSVVGSVLLVWGTDATNAPSDQAVMCQVKFPLRPAVSLGALEGTVLAKTADLLKDTLEQKENA